tara:strand:- start:5450 stop:5860 length:411 start_codon:yes stop_codon:yes gene_type:complete
MALDKPSKGSEDYKMLETLDDEWAKVLRDLMDKFHSSVDITNSHITDVSSMKSDIATNNAKTGITEQQAKAITANSLKVGVSLSSALKNFVVGNMTFSLVAGRNVGSFALRVSMEVASGKGKKSVQYVDLPLTEGK